MTVLFINDFETPFRQAFLDLALEQGDKDHYFRGAYQSWVEWRSPSDVCGLDAFFQALDRVHHPDVILSRTPYDHSVDVLEAIEEADHNILYISNRRADSLDATDRWLDACGFPEGELICTEDDKQRHMAHCQYLIDDRPKTLVQFAYSRQWIPTPGLSTERRDRKAFGLLFEYNRALTDVPGIFLAPTWAGIGYYLAKEGVIDERASFGNLSFN